MFLFQDADRAVLYTGDIRAETWWVNSIVQNPVLLPYAVGSKTLEAIYLDTTSAADVDVCPGFQAKASGLKDLITQISRYPANQKFHMNSWTFGYERAWLAVASAFDSKVRILYSGRVAFLVLRGVPLGIGCFLLEASDVPRWIFSTYQG